MPPSLPWSMPSLSKTSRSPTPRRWCASATTTIAASTAARTAMATTPGFGGKQGVVAIAVRAAVDAAIVVVADAHQRLGVGDREVFDKDGIDQGKDGGIGTDAQRECEHGSGGKARGLSKLP